MPAPVEFAVAYVGKDHGPPPLCYPDVIPLRRVGGGVISGYRLALPNLPALAQFVAEAGAAGAIVMLPGETIQRLDDGARCPLIVLATGQRRESVNNALIRAETVEG